MKLANVRFVVDDEEGDDDDEEESQSKSRTKARLSRPGRSRRTSHENGSIPLAIAIGTTAVGAVGAGLFFIWRRVVNKAIEAKKKRELEERKKRAQAQSKTKSSGVRGIYDTHDSMVRSSVANIPRNRSANNKKNKARRKEKRMKREEQYRIETEKIDREKKNEQEVKRRNQEVKEVEEMNERDKTFTTVSYYSTTTQDARNRAAAQAAVGQVKLNKLTPKK